MTAKVISLQQWKAAHPPILIYWNHGLQCGLAWQKLWLRILFQR